MEYYKIVNGMMMLLHLFTAACTINMIGPSLPDLQCVFGVDLSTVSYLFLGFSIGNGLGKGLSGILFKKIHGYLLLGLSLALQIVATAVFPVSRSIYIAIAMMGVIGFTTGIGKCTVLNIFHVLWPKSSRAVYVLFSASSVGSVAAPLLLQPFLTEKVTRNIELGNISLNTSFTFSDRCGDGVSLIHWPYILTSLLALPSIINHIVCFWKSETSFKYQTLETAVSTETKQHISYVVLFVLFFIQVPSMVNGFSGLFTAYGNTGLGLSLRTMSWMTFVLWTGYTAARTFVCFLPDTVSQWRIIFGCVLLNVLGVIFLTMSLHMTEITLWICCFLLGISAGPLTPATMNWANEMINLTPNIKALLLGATSVGMFYPYVCGIVMSAFGYESFVYFSSAVCLSTDFILVVIKVFHTLKYM